MVERGDEKNEKKPKKKAFLPLTKHNEIEKKKV